MIPSLLVTWMSVSAVVDEDPQALLRAMQSACNDARTIHCTMSVVERPTRGDPSTLFVEAWMDVRGQRLRVEFRDPERPEPHLVFVDTPRGLLVYQADADQVAQDPGPRDWTRMVQETLLGELWRTGFGGQLGGMRLSSYGKPRWVGENDIHDRPCHELQFIGNAETRLWIDQKTKLPRRIVGPLPGLIRDETIVTVEVDEPLDEARFRLTPPPGRPVLPLIVAQQSWANLPPQRDRWPGKGTRAPELKAVQLDGDPVTWPDQGGVTVLAFWFGSAPVVKRMVEMENALLDLPEDVPLLSVHHGANAQDIRASIDAAELEHTVWMAGTGPENPFRAYRIASCPVFFVLEPDRTVLGASREVEDVLGLLRQSP